MSMPAVIQAVMAGRQICLASMIPPVRGSSTRMKGAFLNAASNMGRCWIHCDY